MPGLINWKEAQKVIRHQVAAKRACQRRPGREREAYRFIITYKAKHDGNSPSMREICAGIDIASTNTVSGYLDKLVSGGLITRRGGHICIVGGKWTPPESKI